MHFKFEYTAPGTPQKNGKIERKFATHYRKSRAMLNAATFNWPSRHKMWAYSANQATVLENITVKPEHTATALNFISDNESIVYVLVLTIFHKNQIAIFTIAIRWSTAIHAISILYTSRRRVANSIKQRVNSIKLICVVISMQTFDITLQFLLLDSTRCV
jgi:hypothetical protein